MPISFLNRRRQLQRLGKIRLGHKETKLDPQGKPVISKTTGQPITYPVNDPFFIVPPELREIYGERPTKLNICFLSDCIDDVFPNFMRNYSARGLRCLGDGENIIYRVDDQGVVNVQDGVVIGENGQQTRNADGSEKREACPGEACKMYIDGVCKPTGFLRFMVMEYPRQGYYQLTCHQMAVVRILSQLELTRNMFGRISDIPFVLHRGDEENVPVKTAKGVVDMRVRTQWIEVEPSWLKANLFRRQAVLQESVQLKRLSAGVAALPEFEETADDDEYVSETVDGEVVDSEATELEPGETTQSAPPATQPPVTDKPAPEQSEPYAKTTQPTQRKLGNGALEAIGKGLSNRGLTTEQACNLLKVDTIEAGFALAKGSVSTFWDMLTEAQEAANG